MQQPISVVWHKSTDLRTHDHEPLARAHSSNLAVLHVFVVDLEGSPLRVITPTDCLSRIALPGSRKIGWRYDTYDVRPDTFRKNPSQLARPAPGSAA